MNVHVTVNEVVIVLVIVMDIDTETEPDIEIVIVIVIETVFARCHDGGHPRGSVRRTWLCVFAT